MPSTRKQAVWQANQQKETGASERGQVRSLDSQPLGDNVELFMFSNYRDVAKAGQIWTTDAVKAAELVKLGRAQIYDSTNKKHANASRAN